MVWILFFSSLVRAQDYTAQELDALTMIREADLGIERVYVDQDHFYYTLPGGLETPTEKTDGAMVWTYDGQAVFDDVVADDPQAVTWTEKDYVLTRMDDDPDEYFSVGTATEVDEYGRRWVLAYVDLETARGMREDYDTQVLDMFGGASEWSGSGDDLGIEYNDDAGLQQTGILTSWDTVACGGTDWFFDQSTNGDIVPASAVPMNARQRKIVWIVGPEGCTGTMVDSRWVLTAAHCITNSAGNRYVPSAFTVCTMENLDENTTGSYEAACFGVSLVTKNPSWSGDSDSTADDYGLLKLDGAPGVGWFALSAASDSTFSGYTDFLRGYPGKMRDCSNNLITNNALTTDDSQNGRRLFSANGDVQATPTGYVKYDTSVALGVSGGPHYYCPNGSGCADGHYITGVQSIVHLSCSMDDADTYHNPPCASGYTAGPKARDIRDWVIANTP